MKKHDSILHSSNTKHCAGGRWQLPFIAAQPSIWRLVQYVSELVRTGDDVVDTNNR